MLRTIVNETEQDPIDKWAGRRKDGRDLITAWAEDKAARKLAYKVVQNNEELAALDLERTDYLLGIFANGHIPMEYKRDKSGKGQPSLEEMTVAALKILGKESNGFLLVVSQCWGV